MHASLPTAGRDPPSAFNPHGTLADKTFYSPESGNSRIGKVYLPPDYFNSEKCYGAVVFHEGVDYLNLAYAKNVLDNLIAEHKIEAVVVILVPPVKERLKPPE